jgi:hypothetical protein
LCRSTIEVDAYNAAAAQYNTEVYNPYKEQYSAYEAALNEYNAGPRTSDYAGPAAPTLARNFDMTAPAAPTPFGMAAPAAPKDFDLSAPVLPFNQEEVVARQQAAAQTARKDAGNRALAIDVVGDPNRFNFGSMSVANRFMAEGGPVNKSSGPSARDMLDGMSDPKEDAAVRRMVREVSAGGKMTEKQVMAAAKRVAAAGRGGDELLAYLSPESMAFLKSRGGSGTINPVTGLPEFKGGILGKIFGSGDKPAPAPAAAPAQTEATERSSYASGADLSNMQPVLPAAAAQQMNEIANTPGMGVNGIGLNLSGQSLAPDYTALASNPSSTNTAATNTAATNTAATNTAAANTAAANTGTAASDLSNLAAATNTAAANTAAANTAATNTATTANTANTLTADIARDLMQRSMTTGVPTSEFDKYGGYNAVKNLYNSSGGTYSLDEIDEGTLKGYATQVANTGVGNLSVLPMAGVALTQAGIDSMRRNGIDEATIAQYSKQFGPLSVKPVSTTGALPLELAARMPGGFTPTNLSGTGRTSVSGYIGPQPGDFKSILSATPIGWDGRPATSRPSDNVATPGTTAPQGGSLTPTPVNLATNVPTFDYSNRGIGTAINQISLPSMGPIGQARDYVSATNPNNYFAQSRPSTPGLTAGTTALAPIDMPLAGAKTTLNTLGSNSNLSPAMLGGQQNAGVMRDRLGNVIYSPGMPGMRGFAKGGLAEVNAYNLSDEDEDPLINTDPVGSAQQMLSQLTRADKPSPTRQSVKRVAKSSGGASAAKEMDMKVDSLASAKDLVPQLSDKGSSRQQMEELARVYQLKIKAAKDKARGLGASTFGAPTLEGTSLTKNTLAKKRFNKGGEAKAGSAKEELGALKKLGVLLRDMDVSPTDLMAVLGKTSTAMGTALTPVSLNEGEDKELRRRQSQSATIDNPPKRFNEGGEAKKSDAVEMGASLTPQQIERLAEQGTAEREAASRPAFVSPNMPRATKISQANDPTDRIMGVLEPAVTLGTGAVAAAVGMPRGIYKGLTSGQVGEGKAASIASKEAADFIERNTYVPRSESGKENLAALSKIAEDLKLAPAPGGAAMASLARPTAMAAQGANIADDFLQYNRQISVPGASYAVPPQGRVKTPAPASGLGFYSAAEQAALNLPRKEGSGAAFLNDLMKAPDVKKEELSAMGLDEFLKSKPKATREEVQDFIANNRLDVKEVQLGGKVVEDPAGLAKRKEIFDKYEPAILELYRQMDAAPGEYSRDREQGLLDQALEIQFRRDQEADAAYTIPEPLPTRFNRPNLVLPGGENYREILLTISGKKPPLVTSADDPRVKILGSEAGGWEVLVDGKTVQSYRPGVKESSVRDYAPADANEAIERRATRDQYRSSHFDEPNILAHMRVNDRVDADGKKMLLIEELQSDWHQAGREQGYKSSKTDSRSAAIAKPMNGYFEVSDQNGNFIANVMNHDLANPTQEAAVAEAQRRIQAPQVGRQADDPRVPDAPFKDTWHQLALKRALKYAADNGYERVGLTTGKQQSQRYNMSTQVDNISYEPTAKGFYINVISKDGPNVLNGDYSVKELEGIVGKELTQKMLAKEGKNEFDPKIEPDLVNIRRLDGVDLELEDKGMKKYYDEIYPTFLAKQAKKYGAQVGETTIPTGRVRDAQGIPAMYPTNEPIRYIDITPGMQDAVPYAKGGMVDKNTAFIKAHS